ncbi:hypothetical protein GUJ93_ZPchr0004g39442 [Zizania palustris]|uniref:Uncharacterized protein n=1 Tax=Zizania palustris TaxID=103762 RepID=A0A8J5VFU9_ZIZPA|nr:hypothetical protein GUJ93_ZPchr0004g39442 [Zizania palustris]
MRARACVQAQSALAGRDERLVRHGLVRPARHGLVRPARCGVNRRSASHRQGAAGPRHYTSAGHESWCGVIRRVLARPVLHAGGSSIVSQCVGDAAVRLWGRQ